MAQQEGVESGEKVYPTIPRKFERLRDVIFHSIWGSFAIGLVLLGSVPSPGPNNRPMQTLILLLGLDTQQQGMKEKHTCYTEIMTIRTLYLPDIGVVLRMTCVAFQSMADSNQEEENEEHFGIH